MGDNNLIYNFVLLQGSDCQIDIVGVIFHKQNYSLFHGFSSNVKLRVKKNDAPLPTSLSATSAVVTVDNSLGSGQTDTGSGELGRTVQTLKCSEQLTGVCHIETYAIIAYIINFLAVYFHRVKLYNGLRCFGSELPGIVDQIGH